MDRIGGIEQSILPKVTFPTKVPSDSLGWIGSLKRTSDKSLFPMALGSCGHRITHQLRPINMNGRSILAVTSKVVLLAAGGVDGLLVQESGHVLPDAAQDADKSVMQLHRRVLQ